MCMYIYIYIYTYLTCLAYIYIYIYIYIYTYIYIYIQTCYFRKQATSAPAKLERKIHNASRNRAHTQILPQGHKLHVYGRGTFGAFWFSRAASARHLPGARRASLPRSIPRASSGGATCLTLFDKSSLTVRRQTP